MRASGQICSPLRFDLSYQSELDRAIPHRMCKYNTMHLPTDPLFTLKTPRSSSTTVTPDGSAVTGVCFLQDSISRSNINPLLHYDESDSDTECNFRCSEILLGPKHSYDRSSETAAAVHFSASSHTNLHGCTLASCHHDGSCKIWDLSSRRCSVENINNSSDRKFGLAVRRLCDSSNRFLYQTRDMMGTVTLHDMCHDPSIELMNIETRSSTFCTFSPCQIRQDVTTDNTIETAIMGAESNLVALPTEFHSMAIVRDLRCDSTTQPAYRVHVGQDTDTSLARYSYYGRDNKYGMLMSLALSIQHDTRKLVLGCGMEDGSVLFYDLGHGEKGHIHWVEKQTVNDNLGDSKGNTYKGEVSNYICSTKLGKEPVLSIDLTTSHADHKKKPSNSPPSLVAVAGCAGDADELHDLPEQDRGTVTLLKVSLSKDNDSTSQMKSSIRARSETCSYSSGGKVGVSIARFRPDGRVFAVGGWDRRLRIFGRTTSKPLAVLHGGHSDSVVAMDWAQNSAVSGLLATGAGDGNICLYRVLPHTLTNKIELQI